MKPIPDYSERRRLAERAERARREREKVRRIAHVCGHEQGHVIEDGYCAPEEYKRLRHEPCGACAGACAGSWDGPDLPDYDDPAPTSY
jgi:hypothetical protein